jgi:hypothetical protein
MGAGIYIPIALIAIIVPTLLAITRRRFKGVADGTVKLVDDEPVPFAGRLTSSALQALPSPPWRVVYEIGGDKLGDVEHVLIGPAGAYALTTSMEPLSSTAEAAGDATQAALAKIAADDLDRVLARCAMKSSRVVHVHWGAAADGDPTVAEPMEGVVAVDGRHLATWAAGLDATALTPTQVDLAWQTVLVAIGRPDPLA